MAGMDASNLFRYSLLLSAVALLVVGASRLLAGKKLQFLACAAGSVLMLILGMTCA